MALKETLLEVKHRPLMSQVYEAVMNPVNYAVWAPGGSTLLIKSELPHRLVVKDITEAQELIAIRIGDTELVGLCMRVHVDVPEFVKCTLSYVQSFSRDRVLIAGDLKARHPNWCHRGNTRGKYLDEWTANVGWSTAPPHRPTFWNLMSRPTTIDLEIHYAVSMNSVRVSVRPWDGQ